MHYSELNLPGVHSCVIYLVSFTSLFLHSILDLIYVLKTLCRLAYIASVCYCFDSVTKENRLKIQFEAFGDLVVGRVNKRYMFVYVIHVINVVSMAATRIFACHCIFPKVI